MGKGSSGLAKKNNASADGALINSPKQTITTTAYLPGSRSAWNGYTTYKDEVLVATTDGSGNLTFSYAQPVQKPVPSAKTNKTAQATFEITHGAVNGSTVGIDWNKVNSISGQTYSVKNEAKQNGLKWNSKLKIWKR